MEEDIENYSQTVMFRGTPSTPFTLNVWKSLKSPGLSSSINKFCKAREQRIKRKIIAQII